MDVLCAAYRDRFDGKDVMFDLRIHLLEFRNLAGKSTGLIGGHGFNDPFIKCTHDTSSDKWSEDTKKMEKTCNAVLDRVVLRSYVGQPTDFFASVLTIAAYDKRLLVSDVLIGGVSFGITDIFLSDGHLVPTQWYPLLEPDNPENDSPGRAQGYIKMQISINAPQEVSQVEIRKLDWEYNVNNILHNPRLLNSGVFLLKAKIFRGVEMEDSFGSCDPFVRLWCSQGNIQTEVISNTVDPNFETQLQVIIFEPTGCDLILIQRYHNELFGEKLMAELTFSWKDIYSRRDQYTTPRWVPLYTRPQPNIIDRAVAYVGETTGLIPREGAYQEASLYGGRLLMSFEVEQFCDMSIGALPLKQTDIAMYTDDPQSVFIGLKVFTAQNMATQDYVVNRGQVQVELKVGGKSAFSTGVPVANGFAQFFQTVDLELELPYDNDLLGKMQDMSDDSELNDFKAFIDTLPDVWIKVYKVFPTEDRFTRALLGFKKYHFKELLKREGDDADFATAPNAALWFDDPFANPGLTNSINYEWSQSTEGATWSTLFKDSTCSLPEIEVAGFLSFSFHCFIPKVQRVVSATRKSRVLNPFEKLRVVPLHPPGTEDPAFQELARLADKKQPPQPTDERDRFQIRAHFYQAAKLPARGPVGLANAYVWISLAGVEDGTNVINSTNNPTWDQTVMLPDVVLPVNRVAKTEMRGGRIVDLGTRVACSPLAPWIEVTVWDKVGAFAAPVLIGRFFVRTDELGPNQPKEPEWRELFLGNPEKDDGYVLCSFQLINYTENDSQLQAPLLPLRPSIGMKLGGDDDGADDDKRPQDIFYRHEPVKMVPAKVQVRCLGLRDITPWNPIKFFGVASPHIEFICDDPDTKIVTPQSSKPSGANANFMQIAEMTVLIPDIVSVGGSNFASNFAPTVDVIVYDNTMGMSTVIAHGAIPLVEYYPDNGDYDPSGEDPAVKERKRREADRLRRFKNLLAYFVSQKIITPPQVKQLMLLYKAKDERVMKIFEQYEEAPSSERFVSRVLAFLLHKQNSATAGARRKDVSQQHVLAFKRLMEVYGGPNSATMGEPLEGYGMITFAFMEQINKWFANDQRNLKKKFEKAKHKKQRNMYKMEMRELQEKHEILKVAFDKYQASPDKETFGKALAEALNKIRDIENAKKDAEEEEEGDVPAIEDGPRDGFSAMGVLSPGAGQTGTDFPDPSGAGGGLLENGGGFEGNDADEWDEFGDEDDDLDDYDELDEADMMRGEDGFGENFLVGNGAPGEDEGGDLRPDEVVMTDDIEPVPYETVRGGEITMEWLAFRHHLQVDSELELDEAVRENLDGKSWAEVLGDSFDEVPLTRGPPSEARGVECGWVKCVVKVYKWYADKNDETKGEYRSVIDPTEMHERVDMNEEFPPNEVEVRVYILKAFQMSPIEVEDGIAKADNYIKITLGAQTISDEAGRLTCLNPEFYKMWDLKTRLPGEARLQITMLDYNAVSGDREIGHTTVDLEDRWFCDEWNEIIVKPIEVRDLYRPDRPGVSQGKMEMFVDILDIPTSLGRRPEEVNIFSKTLRLEMRVIIWNTAKVACKDGYTSDVYVQCELLGTEQEPQRTDTHPNCKKTQTGNFNYRMNLVARFPDKSIDYLMRIQIWDDNLIDGDESIAEGILPLKSLFQETFDRNVGKVMIEDMEEVWLPPEDPANVELVNEGAERYPWRWFDFNHPNFGFGPRNTQGKIRMSIAIMPRALARKNPAGKGRTPPLELPEPVRPPSAANPILEPEKCKAYINYTIKEFFLNRKCCIGTSCCIILVALLLGLMFLLRQGLGLNFP